MLFKFLAFLFFIIFIILLIYLTGFHSLDWRHFAFISVFISFIFNAICQFSELFFRQIILITFPITTTFAQLVVAAFLL